MKKTTRAYLDQVVTSTKSSLDNKILPELLRNVQVKYMLAEQVSFLTFSAAITCFLFLFYFNVATLIAGTYCGRLLRACS
jgi:hypothetical protein